jgi:catechol 2,3-dioxygenase-like lactoylglutathione lyase family enzyme
MAGIVFVRTTDLDRIVRFYIDEIGMTRWLDQTDISILRHGNMLIGFCRSDRTDTDALITFFFGSREEVDHCHRRLSDRADGEPRVNPRFRIYHFYATDPDERRIEFQCFLHKLPERPVLEW